MHRKIVTLAAGLALSCHAPTGTVDRSDTGRASVHDAAQSLHWPDPTDGDDPIPAVILASPPRATQAPPMGEDDGATVIIVDTKPKRRPDKSGETMAATSVDLCCDEPSGLCYRSAPSDCTSQSSLVVVCPRSLVRDVCADDGIVICAR